MHTGEIAAAVPASLLLFTHAEKYRAWLCAAVILLAVPWMLATSAAMFLAPLFPVAYVTYTLGRSERAALGAALASAATIGGLFALYLMPVRHAVTHAHLYPYIDPRLAEASWRQFVLPNVTNRPVMWLLRLPTWAGLIIYAVGALALANVRGPNSGTAMSPTHQRRVPESR